MPFSYESLLELTGSEAAALILFLLPIVLIAVLLAWAALVVIRHVLHHAHRYERRTMTMLIQLPKETGKEGEKQIDINKIREQIGTTETILAAIGTASAERGFSTWLKGPKELYTLEIVAHAGLISFYVTVPDTRADLLEEQIHAQFPDAVIIKSPDYNMFSPKGTVVGCYMKFKRQNVFPIKTYKKLESDPLNALTLPLTKLREREGIALQFVVKSAEGSWRKPGISIARGLQAGKTLSQIESEKGFKGVLKSFGEFFQSKEKSDKEKEKQRERKLSPMEDEMVKGLDEKASKAGMDVNIRIVATSEDKERATILLQNAIAAFGQYNIYEFGNSFKKAVPGSQKKFVTDFIYRDFDEHFRMVLNTEELASVWHLPLPTTETPNINWLIARGSAPPANLPKEGLHLGFINYRGTKTDVFMRAPDRQRHMYLIGKSGSGKTNTLQYYIAQDLKAGHGLCVIDPHGDLAMNVMGLVPDDRLDDVVVFDPSDTERPMGLNMLEAKSEDQKDFAAAEMVAIFYKLFPPEYLGPMFEHHMRNVMLTLMADQENPGTLVEIPRMFSDTEYQNKWRSLVTDPVVNSYWTNEVDKTTDYHKSEMLGYLISKVGRFVENEMVRNIVGQSHSSFDFRDIMDNKKILICKLSKGLIGDLNADLLGLIIVTKLQMAALSRANIEDETKRHDFFLYIDEFQNFVTDSIATILSEARKYRLDLIIAHQYLGQLVKDNKTTVRDAVLGNVGTTYVSRIGPEDTETFVKMYEPTFGPYDLMNSELATWYAKIIVDNSSVRPFAMKLPRAPQGDMERAKKVAELSRLKYARPKAIVEAEIMERAALGGKGGAEEEAEAELMPDPFAELLK